MTQLISGLSIVIPVYRSEAALPTLIGQLQEATRTLSEPFEVIFICDGSPDQSWAIISQYAAELEWIKGVELMRNFGQHNALLCGIRMAQYSLTVTMDDDLQHRPKDIAVLIEQLGKGYDVVYGAPSREQHTLWRDIASKLTKFALKSSMGVNIASQVSAFRAFRTDLRNAFPNVRGPYISIDVLLSWATTKFSAIKVEHQPRHMGESTYTLRKLVQHAVNMITGFSAVPLRIASGIGATLSLFGAGALFYVLLRYLIQGTTVPGFTFLASVISIFSGAQLFALGVIGEYLASIHFRTMDKPAFAIRRTTESV